MLEKKDSEEIEISFGIEETNETKRFFCPITHQLLEDPVLASDGKNYERKAIEQWIQRKKAQREIPSSPMTGQPLVSTNLYPNFDLKQEIENAKPRSTWNAIFELEEEVLLELMKEQASQSDLYHPTPDPEKRTALMYAVLTKRHRVLEYLLGRNENGQPKATRGYVNLQDSSGRTALMLACCEREIDLRTIGCLLANGADPKILNKKNGRTALMYAVLTKRLDIVTLLTRIINGQLIAGDVNIQDSSGYTALMLACNERDTPLKIIKHLLAYGASIGSRNCSPSPFTLAEGRNRWDIVQCLTQHHKDLGEQQVILQDILSASHPRNPSSYSGSTSSSSSSSSSDPNNFARRSAMSNYRFAANPYDNPSSSSSSSNYNQNFTSFPPSFSAGSSSFGPAQMNFFNLNTPPNPPLFIPPAMGTVHPPQIPSNFFNGFPTFAHTQLVNPPGFPNSQHSVGNRFIQSPAPLATHGAPNASNFESTRPVNYPLHSAPQPRRRGCGRRDRRDPCNESPGFKVFEKIANPTKQNWLGLNVYRLLNNFWVLLHSSSLDELNEESMMKALKEIFKEGGVFDQAKKYLAEEYSHSGNPNCFRPKFGPGTMFLKKQHTTTMLTYSNCVVFNHSKRDVNRAGRDKKRADLTRLREKLEGLESPHVSTSSSNEAEDAHSTFLAQGISNPLGKGKPSWKKAQAAQTEEAEEQEESKSESESGSESDKVENIAPPSPKQKGRKRGRQEVMESKESEEMIAALAKPRPQSNVLRNIGIQRPPHTLNDLSSSNAVSSPSRSAGRIYPPYSLLNSIQNKSVHRIVKDIAKEVSSRLIIDDLKKSSLLPTDFYICLFFAIFNESDLNLVKYLLTQMSPEVINSMNSLGQFPLTYACEQQETPEIISIVKCLLEHGADPTAKNSEKETAQEIAHRCGNLRVCELISQHEAKKEKEEGNEEDEVAEEEDETDENTHSASLAQGISNPPQGGKRSWKEALAAQAEEEEVQEESESDKVENTAPPSPKQRGEKRGSQEVMESKESEGMNAALAKPAFKFLRNIGTLRPNHTPNGSSSSTAVVSHVFPSSSASTSSFFPPPPVPATTTDAIVPFSNDWLDLAIGKDSNNGL